MDEGEAPVGRPADGQDAADGPADARDPAESVDRGRPVVQRLRATARRVARGTPTPRTALRWLVLVVAVTVPCAVWGATTATADASLGPHLARYEVTVDGEVTVDLGPLGTLVLDSPLPVDLGLRVVVREIPREVTAVEDVDTLAALSADLQSYVQFFSGPEATLHGVVDALVADALRRSGLATVGVVLTLVALRALLGAARRAELGAAVRRRPPLVAGLAALSVVVAGTMTASHPTGVAPFDSQPTSSVFDGTPLEGARITGRLAGVVDTYGGYVVAAYRDNERFYDDAAANLSVAWDARTSTDAALAADIERARVRQERRDQEQARVEQEPPDQARIDRLRTEAAAAASDPAVTDPAVTNPAVTDPAVTDPPVTDPALTDPAVGLDGAPVPTTTDAGVEPAAGAAAGVTGPAPQERAESDGQAEQDEQAEPIVLLLVSDLHCNVGIARVIESAAALAGATIVLNAGDSTVNGTAVESYCVTAFADAVPAGVPLVIADGNHDSAETAAQERGAGALVLDGDVVEVEGLRILGDRDPNATRIGIGTHLVGSETLADAERRLADVACADEQGVDLLLVHNPAVGNATLEQGCASAQLSGHYHRSLGPTRTGQGVRYVSASSAGATLGQPTVGPLRGVAELTILRFDPDTRAFLDHRLISIHPDATVTVGPAIPWPALGSSAAEPAEPR